MRIMAFNDLRDVKPKIYGFDRNIMGIMAIRSTFVEFVRRADNLSRLRGCQLHPRVLAVSPTPGMSFWG